MVPHKQFTFAKLWLMFAKFEVRRMDLPAARKLLGAAVGMCPKEKLFKGYVRLELDVCGENVVEISSDCLSSFASSIVFEPCTRNT